MNIRPASYVKIPPGAAKTKLAGFRKEFRKQYRLQLIMIPLALWAVAMFYLPILGNVIAFQNYQIPKGFLHSSWVGLKNFKDFLSNGMTLNIIRNTLAMSTMNLVFGTIAAVVFAILLNEIRRTAFKRVIQTVSYLPYFISMAVCANIFIQLLGDTGPVNQFLVALGATKDNIEFLQNEKLFWIIITLQSIWKSTGWSAIIYIAAIAGISEEIFEAATIDGAGRFRRIWHITLPGIMPTIAILLIMNSAYVIQGGFEQQLLMSNSLVQNYAEVINTYVYKRGIGAALYSFATAVGLLQSAVSIVILIAVNKVSKKFADISLW